MNPRLPLIPACAALSLALGSALAAPAALNVTASSGTGGKVVRLPTTRAGPTDAILSVMQDAWRPVDFDVSGAT